MSLNKNLKSNLQYNQLLQQQYKAMRELNQINQLMYDTNQMQNESNACVGRNRKSFQNHATQNQYLNDMHQKYPHLFENQDSLFAPDTHWNYSNNHADDNYKQFPNPHSDLQPYNVNHKQNQNIRNKQPSQQNAHKNQKQISQKNNLKDHLMQNQSCHANKKQLQVFQKYLQSLEINQFLQIESMMRKKKGNNSEKNLQSSLQCTFKPSILKKSSQIAVNMQPSFQRLTMPLRNSSTKVPYRPANKQIQKQYSKQRIQRLSKPRILKTQPSQYLQCQKLQLKKKSSFPLKTIQRSSNYLDVASRNQLWEQQKQIKLEKLRKQQQQNRAKKQSSTFAPKITEYKGDKNVNLSSFAKEGLVNYFERLSMAKSKNTYIISGKQNHNNISSLGIAKKQNNSPYCSNTNSINNTQTTSILSKTPKKQGNSTTNLNKKNSATQNNEKKLKQKISYDQAVKQLHKKLMSLNI